MKVILISGKARSGKDTVASIMHTKLTQKKKKVLVTHYADLLKYICRNYFNWNGKKDEKGRAMLQYVGTDIIRKQNPDFWANFVADMLGYFHENWDYVIIPDCRFPNEISVMTSRGFDATHLRVSRPNLVSTLTAEQQLHESETALDGIEPDAYIINDGTRKDLEDAIVKWIKEN